MKRIGRLLVVLGLAVLLFTSVLGSHGETVVVVKQNNQEGFIFEGHKDIYVNVTLDHSFGYFNMYLMHWQDTNDTMAQNRTSNPIAPVKSFENITSWRGMLDLPYPDLYVLLFTSNSTDLLILCVEVVPQEPNMRAFSGGAIMVGVGVAMVVYLKLNKSN
ncbi:MAG: hypothetical protein ACOC38_10625 [Promethearchaeia archaeon]